MSLPAYQPHQPRRERPGALGVLLDILRKTGWKDTTPSDPYLFGTDALVLEPIRHRGASGHTPARVAASGDVVGLVTFDWHGVELDRLSWAYITPHNLERALDYMTAARDAAEGN